MRQASIEEKNGRDSARTTATISTHLGRVLRDLSKLSETNGGAVRDEQLLERFIADRDEAAFTALVQRHGPMVLSVCRSVLHHEHDAEDAFQAAFLTLVRKAASIRRRASLGSWLYGVAYHLAVKAQAGAARRRQVEQRTPEMPATDPLLQMTLEELRHALHEELQRLPEKYRAALVLCHLEGKSHGEAAQLLGWSRRRVKGGGCSAAASTCAAAWAAAGWRWQRWPCRRRPRCRCRSWPPPSARPWRIPPPRRPLRSPFRSRP